jgi:hypothetical protein
MINFEYRQDEDGYEIGCASCFHDAPVDMFLRGFPQKKEEYICELCASTFIGNATEYPDLHDNVSLFQSIAQVGNILLDKLTDRNKDIKRTLVE